MTPPETPPQPESTYRLLLDAAGAWPDGIATQWIPDPAKHTRCLDWTYAKLAGTATRIANALTVLGVRRQDAVTLSSVNTSMLYAATLAAQAVGIAAPVNPALSSDRIAELVRRTGSRVLIAAGPELDPQLWQRLLEVARQAGMTAVLALRADGAHGDPPALGLTGDAPAAGTPDTPNGRGPFDETGLLAWADTAIGEAAARPKRIYPIAAIPLTSVGKQFKPALLADAAVRVVTEALAAAGLADPQVTAAHEDGRLVLTVTGADPDRVRDAVAGFALTVRCGPATAPQIAVK